MRGWSLVGASAFLLIEVASTAYADNAKRKADREAGGVNADAMLDAVKSAAPADGAKFMTAPLRYTNFTFTDDDCAERFARSGSVAKVDLAHFATCMASMRGLRDEFWFVSLTTDKPDPDDSKSESSYSVIRVDPRTHMVVAINHHDSRMQRACDDAEDESDPACGVAGGWLAASSIRSRPHLLRRLRRAW